MEIFFIFTLIGIVLLKISNRKDVIFAITGICLIVLADILIAKHYYNEGQKEDKCEEVYDADITQYNGIKIVKRI